MISFNLTCGLGHGFEGWFGSSSDYEDQQNRGLITCPICNNGQITKALMAPNVGMKSNQTSSAEKSVPIDAPHGERAVMPAQPKPASAPMPEMSAEFAEAAAAVMAEMRKVQKTIETECDNVGDAFAEEARKIHYGESKPRGIYGNTSDEQAEQLIDEGIEIAKMPWLPKAQ